MAKECTDLEREAARSGDKYYRTVTEWLTTRGRSAELRKEASTLARVYSRGLRLVLKCLESLRPSPVTAGKIAVATDLQTRLEKDIEALNPVSNLAAAPEQS